MGEALILLVMLGIGLALGYNIGLSPGETFEQRVRSFFGNRPRTKT